MKNLKIIVLLLLTQNYIQSADADTIGFYKDETSEPNTTIIYHITKKEVPDQELSRKVDPETGRTIIHRLTSNPHYQPKAIPAELDFSNVKFGTLKTSADPISADLQEREEKFKKLRQQDKAATKIQAELRSRQAHEKLKKIREAEADKKNQAELRLKEERLLKDVNLNLAYLIIKIKTLADQSYPKFKELICTSDYLTKTDWLYQFIEAATNKTIFERNSDGTINSEEFTPEFKKEIENPSDWLDDKITKYLPEFHDFVYEAFVDKAVEQIVTHNSSWTDAVSIPTPTGHGSFQEEGSPLFPKIYKSSDSDNNTLILGKIFMKVLETDPKKFDELNFDNLIKFEDQAEYSRGPIRNFFNKMANNMASFINKPYSANDKHPIQQEIDQRLLQNFSDYLNKLGLELSPEEEKQLHENFKLPDESKWYGNTTYEGALQQLRDALNKKVNRILKAKNKFIADHINWASSARQTFYLGQLLFDKNLTAFDALGGQEWLEKQPTNMQKYIPEYIEKIKNSRLTTKGYMRSIWRKKA